MIVYLSDADATNAVLDSVDAGRYVLSYSALRDDFLRYQKMNDDEFSANLLNVLHFVCVVCWLKEKQAQWLLSDTGLIHELVHLMLVQKDSSFTATTKLSDVRQLFVQECYLS